ncbi:MAG: hypothetical protein IJR26_03030 [Bacteroidales bacterium]|nr:hypothetical protein [Bacteroidales bacterium]
MRRSPWGIPTVGGEASQLRQCDVVRGRPRLRQLGVYRILLSFPDLG